MRPAPAPARLAEIRRRRSPLIALAYHPAPTYGTELMLEALLLAARRKPDIGLVVYGPGSDSEKLLALARRLGVADRVEALGELDHAAALGVLRGCDVFARPTLADGDSISVREALALGIRCVASDASARPEGVWAFRTGDAEDLARCLGLALGAPPPSVRSPDAGALLMPIYEQLSGGSMRNPREVDLTSYAVRGRDLVVFSNDWDGDPLSKVHIMRILARDNRVLWVNSIGNRAPKATAHDLRRIAQKARAFAGGIREAERNIFVLSPLAVPLYGKGWARALNGELLRAQVSFAIRRLGFRRPISWSFLPASAPVSGRLGEELVVYHCVDEFSAFADTDGTQIAELERALASRADLIITSADRLFESKRALNPRTVLVRHGVDFEHFVKACSPETPVAPELERLPRPIIGFFGLVAHWVDLDAIAACARAFPSASVVLIGKVSPDVSVSGLKAFSNVSLLGRKRYADLPSFCKGFDVALMPFRISELTLNANPLKVREYLAAGLPVVSSDIPEVARLGLCKIARSSEEFPLRVAECLAEGPGCSRARAERVASESWEARVEEIRHHLAEALWKRAASPA